jgi:hypothetical protein
MKSWSGEYKLIASLKFKFCSTADFFALGFQGVPTYYASPQPNMAEYHGMGYHSDGSEAPSLKSVNKVPIIKNSNADNSSNFIEGLATGAITKPRPVNDTQPTTTNGFYAQHPINTSSLQLPQHTKRQELSAVTNITSGLHFPQPSKRQELSTDTCNTSQRLMTQPLPKIGPSCESFSSVSSGRAGLPTWLQPEQHYTMQTGYSALHREILESRLRDEEAGDISKLKHRKGGTVLHGLKESPAHKGWLDNLLLGPDNKDAVSESPSPPHNKFSQLQPGYREKNTAPDKPSMEDELLRLLNEDRSYQKSYSLHGNSSQLQTVAERHSTPHEGLPSHPASEEKAMEPPQLSGSPGTHNWTPLLPSLQMTKIDPSTETERQSVFTTTSALKQFTMFPLQQQTNKCRDMPQDSQRHPEIIDQSNVPADTQNQKSATDLEASVLSKTQVTTEPLAMEPQTIGNHIPGVPLTSATQALASNPEGYIPAREPSTTPAEIPTEVLAHSKPKVSCTDNVHHSSASPQNTPMAPRGDFATVITSRNSAQHVPKPTELVLSTDNNKTEVQVTGSVTPIEPAEMSGQQIAIPTSQTPLSRPKDVSIAEPAILPTHAPEKRKADSINGEVGLPDVSNGPRKTSTSPALRKSQDFEREFKAAQARIAIAEKRKVELANALESIMLSEKVWEPLRCPNTAVTNMTTKAKKLNQEAEKIERDNLEMQVRVNFHCVHAFIY